MKNSKRAHRILAWLLTMTLIFTMSFSSVAYAADTDTTGEGEVNTTEATSENAPEEAKADPAEDTAKASQEAEQEEIQNPEALGEGETPAAEAVAKIGDNEYATFAEAVEAVQDGDTILLLDDIDITDIGVVNVNDCTIDLNNHKISADNFTAIFQGKNLIFKNGKFDSKGGSYALFIGDEGETDNVLVENCTLTGGINVYNASNIVLRNVDVTGTKYYAVWLDEGAKATIESGSYKSNSNKVLGLAKGDVGTTLEIKGGSYTYEENEFLYDNGDDGAKPVITGGQFSTDPTSYVPAKGYVVTEQSDGTWTVETRKVAVIGDKKYASLKDAVADVPDNGTETTIKLIGDVEVEKHVAINSGKNIVLDLNGFNVTSNTYKVFDVGNAKFNITGKGAIIENIADGFAPIIARGSGKDESDYTVITVDKDVTLKGDYSGIFIDKDMAGGNKNYGLVINIKGTIDVSDVGPYKECGIYINGQNTNTEGNVAAINLDGAKIIGAKTGIYAAGYGKWNIKDSEIAAENSAMEIRAGEVVIQGGRYSASKVPTATTPNGNGTTTEGAGIAIAQHTTALPIDVTVKGGTIEGYTGLLVTNPENRGNADKVKVTVEGGSFKAIKGGTNSIAREDNAAEMTLLVNGGYFSDKSAENYLATGKTLVESDKSEFTYMVADKKTAAEADVDIKAAVGNVVVDEKTPDAVKEAIAGSTVSEKALDAAVKREINKDIAVDTEDVNEAITSGVKDGVFADNTKAGDVTVFAQAYLDIAVADNDYDGEKCVLDITPMYQIVATTADSADSINIGTNAVVIGEPQELKVNTAVEVTIPLPAGFTPKDDDTVTIKHTKSDGTVYYYSAEVTITAEGKRVATFTNPNGFSTFEALKLSDNTNLDKVELTFEDESIGTDIRANQLEYDIKFDAEKNVEDLTVNVAATANDRNAKIKVLVGGSEVKGKFVDLGLGTTTFNVLVLSEDDTAVLYTFNVIRCELVDDVTLNRDTFTYSGKAQAPAVTVKTADGTTLKNGDAYTVSYKGNRTSVGTHTVTVLCKGKYEGEISKNYTINPAKPAIKKIKSSKRKMKVYMTTKPGSNGAEYYKISYRQKGTSTWKSTTATSSSKTIKGLKKGKRYYVKVCAYTGSYKSDDSTTKLSKKIR